jgi:hypothetical protein
MLIQGDCVSLAFILAIAVAIVLSSSLSHRPLNSCHLYFSQPHVRHSVVVCLCTILRNSNDTFWTRVDISSERRLLLRHVCQSVRLVCLHVSARLPVDGFSWNLIRVTFTKVCLETSNLIENGKKSKTSDDNRRTLVCLQQYKIFCSSAKVQREHILAFQLKH